MKSAWTIFLLALVSCNVSTESKLAAAIKEHYKEGFKSEGDKVESIEVDNVTYRLTDSSIYYGFRLGLESEYFSKLTPLLKVALEMPGDTTVHKILADQDTSGARSECLERLMMNAQKGIFVYKVNYHIKYKTNRDGVDENDSIFLHYPDLQIVYLNIDSVAGVSKLRSPTGAFR